VSDAREVPENLAGARLDVATARLFPEYSRARLQTWIEEGALQVNGVPATRVRASVSAGDRLELGIMPAPSASGVVAAEPIPLEVVWSDATLAVINKPAGLTVHPGAGVHNGTLQNALLHRFPQTTEVPRAGLVHRLDKDTSGLLIVARTPQVHTRLVVSLAARQIGREYLALVWGRPPAGGRLEQPIGRDRRRRTRMAVSTSGRAAVTHYRIERRLRAHTLLRVRLETGRTHQIRVHLMHAGLPIVGDPVYGGRQRLLPAASAAVNAALRAFRRQALHAQRLQLQHPLSGRALTFEAPLPADFSGLLAALETDQRLVRPARPARK
jgi:23S rRNA pseudouridine1911/1915/1917 synthase